jgi:hypothetical protein
MNRPESNVRAHGSRSKLAGLVPTPQTGGSDDVLPYVFVKSLASEPTIVSVIGLLKTALRNGKTGFPD